MAYEITEECIMCGTCIEECPEDSIEHGQEIFLINPEKCVECGLCEEACPVEAIIKK